MQLPSGVHQSAKGKKSWPPSPSVEDEEVALAREHGSDDYDSDVDSGQPPSSHRGSVDQYPILVNVGDKLEDVTLKEQMSRVRVNAVKREDHQPVDKAQVHDNSEKRFLHIPRDADNPLPEYAGPQRPRSKSTTRPDEHVSPRGRPQVTRIQTDLGRDLRGAAPGQRRAPSPYAYRPSASSATLQPAPEVSSKPSLLSPGAATVLRPSTHPQRRSRSTRPARADSHSDISDSDAKTAYRRHRSKSRHTRDNGLHGDTSDSMYKSSSHRYRSRSRHARNSIYNDSHSGAESHSSRTHDPHRSKYDRSRRSPTRESYDKHSATTHRSAHGHITPPQTPRPTRESPCTSAAEDSDRRRRGSPTKRSERRYSKESPYTSSTEGSGGRKAVDERTTKSRHGSLRRPNKPQLDLSDQETPRKLELESPISAKTPRTFEDYFQKALDDNVKTHTSSRSRQMAHPPPRSSPPTSPPRTPRGERKMRDYFEMNALTSTSTKQRSRPPSIDDPVIKPMTSLLGAATLGASIAAKATPNLSRSSTTSLEDHSTASSSSYGSGPRSRKASPVHEDLRPLSRAGTTTSKDEVAGRRLTAFGVQAERPVSRTGYTSGKDEAATLHPNVQSTRAVRPPSRQGSLTSHEDILPHRTSTYCLREERPSSRSGGPAAIPVQHPPTQRSSSYSSAHESMPGRPGARRTYTTGPLATPAYTNSQPQGSASNLAHAVYSSPAEEQPSAAPTAEPRTGSFPLCPRPYPVTGFNHWYTIQGFQNFDICAACMAVLGASPFRDYCVPSPYRSPSEPITCALSKPWIRIAVGQCLKGGVANLPLLQNLNRLPPDVFPCPGKRSEIRKWYHVNDPSSKAPIHNFDVCTACVRSVELIFPELRNEKLFKRPENKLSQERICNLQCSSKHFDGIIKQLEILASHSRNKDLRPKDVSKFADHVRNKLRYQECARDAMLATPLWHFHPDLPELTICEDCYMDFIWPLADQPIAKGICVLLQPLPQQYQGNRLGGVSCQMYSDRMRKIFREAVARNDFEGLKMAAVTRYNVEHRLQENHRRLVQDQQAGFDRREDIARNSALWKAYE